MVYGFKVDGLLLGGAFIVMEYIKGHDLSDVLRNSTGKESERLMDEFTNTWVTLHSLDGSKVLSAFPDGGTQRYLDELFVMAQGLIDEYGPSWFRPSWTGFKPTGTP